MFVFSPNLHKLSEGILVWMSANDRREVSFWWSARIQYRKSSLSDSGAKTSPGLSRSRGTLCFWAWIQGVPLARPLLPWSLFFPQTEMELIVGINDMTWIQKNNHICIISFIVKLFGVVLVTFREHSWENFSPHKLMETFTVCIKRIWYPKSKGKFILRSGNASVITLKLPECPFHTYEGDFSLDDRPVILAVRIDLV